MQDLNLNNVKELIRRISEDAPFPHPDNASCIRVAIAYALGLATALLPVAPDTCMLALEYLSTADDTEILSIPTKMPPWKCN